MRHRALAAAALVVAAVVLPCTAWYVAGSRGAAREGSRLQDDAREAGRLAGRQMAVQVALRLEGAREVEASRPYFHYQHRYHDPQSGCACAEYRVSPLAGGHADPLIHAYFQIDGEGRLTMPTLDTEVEEEGDFSRSQRQILDELEAGVPLLLTALDRTPERPEAPHFQRVHEMASESPPRAPVDDAHGEILLTVEPFRWRTVNLHGEPRLVAMRHVITTAQELLQGFVVSASVLAAALESSDLPLHLGAGVAAGDEEVAIPIPGAAWMLHVDSHDQLAAAQQEAAAIESRFRRIFAMGAGLALLAGILVVAVVAQSERLARQRAQFAAAAAHELRTPLAGIRLHGEMLAQGLGDRARHGEYAGRVAAEAERLGRVVSNVLEYTRLEHGTLKVQPAPGDLAAALRDCAGQLQASVEADGSRLQVEIADGLPTARFDADAVQQMVRNLVDNAGKYARVAQDRTIHLGLAAGDGSLLLTVRDHGPGVPELGRRRLFRPFTRGTADGESPAGLGLGLAIVDALARAQGGGISYDQAEGGGARFTVTVPLAAAVHAAL